MAAPDVPADGFSVRWQGYLNVPADGQYTFFTSTETEGERLYLDGSLRTTSGLGKEASSKAIKRR